ncbi:hypothetical protein J4458_03345 [Candidatus Woesearchaeota archaeon]|nr:hypothetical protein [Candidatus Woesearchaeota archaeon]
MTQPNIAHLSGGFMITSIVGFLISVFYVFPKSGDCTIFGITCKSLGFTLVLFFTVMFVAAMIAMTYGPDESMKHVGHRKRR